MNIPKLQGIFDEVGFQDAIALLLLDNSNLVNIPVIPEVKGLIENNQMADVLWTLPRSAITITSVGWNINASVQPGGLVGGGLLVELPEMDTDSPNVSGPPATWKISVVGMIEPNTALLPGIGIGMTSSQLCQYALDQLHLLNVFGFGSLKAQTAAIVAAHDWMGMKPGIVAHRVTFTARIGRTQTQRSASVTADFASSPGQCTLNCSDTGADIFYVLNGNASSMPVKSNPNAIFYNGAFNVTSGDEILAASRKAGLNTSEIFGYTAP